MATNYRGPGNVIMITGPSGGLSSGDPYAAGQIALVADVDIAEGAEGAAFRVGKFTLSVKGIDGAGNSAVVFGDQLYYVSADTPKISKKATGDPFGKALAAVTPGSTASIDVQLEG